MLYLFQMVLSKMLTALPLQNQCSWQLSFLELLPCCILACNTVTSTVTTHCSAVISPSASSGLYTSTVQSGFPLTNAALLPHPRLQTSYPPYVHNVSSPSTFSLPPHAPGCPSTPPASSTPKLSLRVLQ